jgi:tape measure domain-containing protein
MADNLNLALKITADLSEAQREIAAVGENLSSLISTSSKATQETRNLTTAQNETATANSHSAKGWQDVYTAQNEAMRRGHEYMQQQERTRAAQEKATAEAEKQRLGLSKLLSQIDPLERKLNRLDELEIKLAQSHRAGAIDAEGYAAALGKITTQRNALFDGDKSGSAGAGDDRSPLMALAKPLLAAVSINEIKKRSDAWADLQNRLRGVTDTNEQLAAATEQVQQAATRSARPLESTAELYQRIATSGDKLALTYRDIGRLTETVNKAVTLDGLSSSQQNSIIEQIGRSFAAGTLEGMRFNTVLKQTPALTQAIATGMGVTADSVLKMAAKNKLSLEDVSNALKGQADVIDEKYAKTQTTISSAFGVLNDSLTTAIGKLDQATGASNRFTNSILEISGAINQLSAEPLDFLRGASEMKSLISVDRAIASQKAEINALQEKQKEYADKGGVWAFTAKSYGTQINNLTTELDKLEKRRAELTKADAAEETPGAKAGSQYNPEYEKYLETLQKAESKVQKLSYLEQARADITSGRLGKLTEEQKKELEGQAQTADKLKENTKLETNLATLRKEVAVSGQKNSKTAAIQYEIENGWLKGATKEVQANALALAKQADAQRQSKTASTKTESENERYVKSLTQQATKVEQSAAAIREHEIATRNLTTAQRTQAEAANKALTAQENTTANLKLQIQLWKVNGDTAQASAAEITEKYRKLREEFERVGNTEGVQKIDVLVTTETAMASLAEINKKIQELNSARANEEQLLQAQREAGLISEYDKAEQILALHKATAAEIAKMRPGVEALAQQPGNVGKQATQSLKQMDAQLLQLNSTASMLEASLKEGLTTGLNDALSGLAKGTMSLGDAVKSLGNAVLDSLVKMASQGLSSSIVSGLGGLMGGAGAGGGWAGMASSIGSLFFADGGHVRGPGTDTSDSIPAQLSNYEYVTRASVVRQPGALPFLDDFNRRGMGALNDWASRVKHATGGLAGIPAPLAPAPISGNVTLPEAASPNITNEISNKLQLNLIDDPARLAEVITTPEGQEALTVVLSRNAGKFRQVLGLPS